MSERKIGQIIKFFYNANLDLNLSMEQKKDLSIRDRVEGKICLKHLAQIENKVSIKDTFIKIKRSKTDRVLQTTKE